MVTTGSGDARAGASVSAAAADLLETLRMFWPGAQVGLDRDPAGADQAFAMLPSAARPRMLAPLRPKAAAATAMLRYSAALGLRETVQRSAIYPILRFVGADVLARGCVTVRGGDPDNLGEHLAGVFNEPVSFAVTIGKRRANRKPVLQVFDRTGRALAFIKVGDTDESRARVAAEAQALDLVAGRLRGFQVPRVLATSQWHGLSLLVMTPLGVRPQDPRGLWGVPLGSMTAFSLQLGHRTAPLAEVPQWLRLRAAADAGALDPLEGSLDELERVAAGMPDQVVGAWHGDWTAWNMARRGPDVQLWDFERFDTGVVHGLDPFHYAVNSATLRDGEEVPVVLGALERVVDLTGSGARARLVAAIYLVAICERYLGRAEPGRGGLIRHRADLMVRSLATWLPTVTGGRIAG